MAMNDAERRATLRELERIKYRRTIHCNTNGNGERPELPKPPKPLGRFKAILMVLKHIWKTMKEKK